MDRYNLRTTIDSFIEKRCPQGARVFVSTGGIDSAALVVACRDLNIEPTVVSFTLADRESSDFQQGRRIAEWAKLDFMPIYLSRETEDIEAEIWRGITSYSLRKKAAIETFYPLAVLTRHLSAVTASPPTVLITGHGSDGHFCVSKRGMMHFRQTQELFQQFRRSYFADHANERRMLENLAADSGLRYVGPYWDSAVFNMFAESCWEDVNRPRQKEPIRAAFPELDPLRIGDHRNLQLGDSGIAEIVGETMRRKYTPTAKSPVSAYNLLIKHYEKERSKRQEGKT